MIRDCKGARRFRLFGWMAAAPGADAAPMIGTPMIPRTCAYVRTVLIGYSAVKQERPAKQTAMIPGTRPRTGLSCFALPADYLPCCGGAFFSRGTVFVHFFFSL